MALPPIDMAGEFEDDIPADDGEELDEDLELEPTADDGVDPMVAADLSEAFPELDDAQIAAVQRAVLTLIANAGGGSAPPMAAPPMGL
jgi:hypothetical protein